MWLTVKETSKYLKISISTLYKLVKNKKIPVSKIGKIWRFNKNDIDTCLIKLSKLNDDIKPVIKKEKSVTKSLTKPNEISKGSTVWKAYVQSYKALYKVEPTRNAKTNTICKRLIDLVGIEKSLVIVRHYLNIKDAFYLRAYHKIDFCLSDYQKILTSYQANIKINDSNAREFERTQNMRDVFDELRQEWIQKEKIDKRFDK